MKAANRSHSVQQAPKDELEYDFTGCPFTKEELQTWSEHTSDLRTLENFGQRN